MKKILLSIFTVALVAAAAVYGTSAFFNDTETSTGNKFVAGDIDLQIDNSSFALDYNIPTFDGTPSGRLVASTNTSWTMRDLTVEKFFDFVDLKPGDYGEDTISIHVGSNDAWLCAATQLTEDQDNSCTDPEKADDLTCTDPNGDGELDNGLNFAFWVDDGDNVFEACPEESENCTSEDNETTFLTGPLSSINDQGQLALADSQNGILGGNSPIPGGTTFYIGKIWCFGELRPRPSDSHDGQDNPVNTDPSERGDTGWECDGTLVTNAAQTDSVVGDLQFYAVQSRHNDAFLCSGWTPKWPTVQ